LSSGLLICRPSQRANQENARPLYVAAKAGDILPDVQPQFGELPRISEGMVWPELDLSPAAFFRVHQADHRDKLFLEFAAICKPEAPIDEFAIYHWGDDMRIS
jgi:hypothetical protein